MKRQEADCRHSVGSYDDRYRAFYDRDSRTYNESRFESEGLRQSKDLKNALIVEVLEKRGLLQGSAELLDVASGTGRIAHVIAQKPVRRVLAADISFGMLRENSRIDREVLRCQLGWLNVNMKSLPFDECRFDAATLGSFLYLVPLEEYSNYVSDVRRVLRPGGVLLCEVSNALGILNPRNALFILWHKCLRKRKVKSFVTAWRIRQLFPGFDLAGIFGLEYPMLARDLRMARSLTWGLGRTPILRHFGGKYLLVLTKA